MATIDAIFSIEKGAEVYHNNSECTERNNIEARNIRAGNGGKRLCAHCAKLNTARNYFGFGGMGGLGVQSIWQSAIKGQKK